MRTSIRCPSQSVTWAVQLLGSIVSKQEGSSCTRRTFPPQQHGVQKAWAILMGSYHEGGMSTESIEMYLKNLQLSM